MCPLYRGFSMRLIASWYVMKKAAAVVISSFNDK